MKFSVVTSTLNSERTLQACLDSVKSQRGVEVEHLVVDGVSSDGTLSILKTAGVKFVSERDSGPYEAFNKGLAASSGEIVSFLGSDDSYLPGALEAVKEAFDSRPSALCVHGNIVVQGREKRPASGWDSAGGARLLHPATFMKRALFDAIGNFDLQFKIASDLDLFLRAKKACDFVYIDKPLTNFSLGGLSTKRLLSTAFEVRAILLKNGCGRLYAEAVFAHQLARSAGSLAKRAVGL